MLDREAVKECIYWIKLWDGYWTAIVPAYKYKVMNLTKPIRRPVDSLQWSLAIDEFDDE